MLNAKSVAINVVDSFNPEWVEEFFGSHSELIEELVEILNQFSTTKEIVAADPSCFNVREINGGPLYCFKKDILEAYGIKARR